MYLSKKCVKIHESQKYIFFSFKEKTQYIVLNFIKIRPFYSLLIKTDTTKMTGVNKSKLLVLQL